MNQYRTTVYEVEEADISKDGKQIRIYKKNESPFMPDEIEGVVTMDIEKAEDLQRKLSGIIKELGNDRP